MGSKSYFKPPKPLLNTKLAFPGMRFHLKCTHESLRAAFREGERDCPQAEDDTAESREVGLTEIEKY